MTRMKCFPSADSVTVTRLSALPLLSSLLWMFLPFGPNKLSTLSVFVHNDDDNEKAAKAAIKEVLRKVRVGQAANFDFFL